MVRRPVIYLLVSLLLPAAPGLAQAAPAWCVAGGERLTLSADVMQLYRETDPGRALEDLVAASCYPDDDLRQQARQIEATRQAWTKRLGLIEGDWVDIAAWAQADAPVRHSPAVSVVERGGWSAYGALDQYAGIALAQRGASDQATDPAYVADGFGARLTQLGRLAFLEWCLDGDEAAAPVRWAMCQADAAGFVAADALAELRADTRHTPVERVNLRLAVVALTPRLAAHAAAVSELRGKDPAYEQMFGLAAQARAAWGTTDPAVAAVTLAMDDARVSGSRKAAAGCEERTWTAWREVVARRPAKDFAVMKAKTGWERLPAAVAEIVADRDGYLAAVALAQCGTLVGNEDLLVRTLGASLARWPGQRGPRTAAQTAILTAGLALDDRDASIEQPPVERAWMPEQTGSGGGGEGVIATIERRDGTAVVTFKKEKVKQVRCTQGHYTNRISQVMGDGQVIYRYECTKEVKETISVAPSPPLTLNARYAAALEVGMFVQILDDVAVTAYRKGGALPAVVAGVGVK